MASSTFLLYIHTGILVKSSPKSSDKTEWRCKHDNKLWCVVAHSSHVTVVISLKLFLIAMTLKAACLRNNYRRQHNKHIRIGMDKAHSVQKSKYFGVKSFFCRASLLSVTGNYRSRSDGWFNSNPADNWLHHSTLSSSISLKSKPSWWDFPKIKVYPNYYVLNN